MATDFERGPQTFIVNTLPNPCQDGDSLLAKAERCRRLAAGISDSEAADVLRRMAVGYEEAAERLAVTSLGD
ncbi:hypothetical protein GCM10022280_14650 [Sphingomonas swuensis]|uniref:Uncharacterized protein n=1 Tax=Sphingomonas swuensis TaxID=977800 RepID=A0ABP7SV65_9SPHN